jgi:hypothetical protein
MSTTHAVLFNFEPSSSYSTSASYTVPSGSYSNIYILNTTLPKLNGINIYSGINDSNYILNLWATSGSVLSFASGTISYQEYRNTY